MCLYPRMIRNPKYKPNKKNGGQVPPILDERTLFVPKGCGKCMECTKQKAREWQLRLMEDIKTNTTGKFITLTFSNESIAELNKVIPNTVVKERWVGGELVKKEIRLEGYDRDNAIATQGVRYFLERWRKKYKKSVRHWLITELGHNGTENIHLHGIIWQPDYIKEDWLTFLNLIEEKWQYGWVWKRKIERGKPKNWVSEQTINYMTKYITKVDIDHKAYKAIILNSAGIGGNYTNTIDSRKNKYNGIETKDVYTTRSGHKMALPTYWRNKLYTDEQREQLWLQKLDKQERYVNKVRIDVSNDEKEYYAALESARELNSKLGYGDDRVNWTRAKYENERRRLRLLQRIGADYPKEWDAWK